MLLAMQDSRQVLQLFLDVQLAKRADVEVVHYRPAVVVAVAGRVQRLHLRGMPRFLFCSPKTLKRPE